MIYAETPRLILRALQEDDLPFLVDRLGDPRVSRWLPGLPSPYGLNEAHAFLQRMKSAAAAEQPEHFLIEHKDTRMPMGTVGMHPPRDVAQEAGERVIGYWLAPDHWHRGYAAEAVKHVVELAFARHNAALLTATTQILNVASEKVLMRSGFQPSHTGGRQSAGGTIIPVQHWRLTRAAHGQWKESA